MVEIEQNIAGSQDDIGLVTTEEFAPEFEVTPREFYCHAISYPPKAREWLR